MKYKVFYIIAFLIVLGFYFYTHEQIHQRILIRDGCIKPFSGVDSTGFYTECRSIGYIESETAGLSHNIAEIVGYNLQIIMLLLFINRLTKEED